MQIKIIDLLRQSNSDIVISAYWSAFIQDNGYLAELNFTTGFSDNSVNNEIMIPFFELTENVIIGWIQNTVGLEFLNEVELILLENINLQKNPVVNNGIPFE